MVVKLRALLTGLLLVANAGAADLSFASPNSINAEIKLSEVGTANATFGLVFISTSDGDAATGIEGGPPCVGYSPGLGTYSCNGTIAEIGSGIYSFAPNSSDIPSAGRYTFSIGVGSSLGYGANILNLKVAPNDSPMLTESCVNTNPGTNSLCSLILAETSRTGTAQSYTRNSLRMASSEAFATNELRDNFAIKIVRASGGAGEGQVACICSNIGSTDWVTFCDQLQTEPTGTVTYAIISAPECNKPRPVRRW